MECSKQFDYEKAFHEVDDWNYGFIDAKNLKSFLRKHGFVAAKKDILAIIRRLDLDGDAKVSMPEFLLGLTPMQPYSKLVNRQKERQRSAQKYLEKQSKGGHSVQDPLINLERGQRDIVRVAALDRRQIGDKSCYAIKLRPDLLRV